MKLNLLIVLCLLLNSITSAQNTSDHYMPEFGTFILQGNVINKTAKDKAFNLAVSDPYGNKAHTIAINPDGSFQQEIPIRGMQDIYLYLGDAVTVSVCPNDTLQLTYDRNKRPSSIQLSSNNKDRNKELNLNLIIYHKFRQRTLDLTKVGYNVDTVGINTISRYIKDYQQTILTYEDSVGRISHHDYFLMNGYFEGIQMLSINPNILYQLWEDKKYKVRCFTGEQTEDFPLYNDTHQNPFLCTAFYRFMLNYVNSTIYRTIELFTNQDKDEGVRFVRMMRIIKTTIPNQEYATGS